MRRLIYKKRGSLAWLRVLLGISWRAPLHEIARTVERGVFADPLAVDDALFAITGCRDRKGALRILRADEHDRVPPEAA